MGLIIFVVGILAIVVLWFMIYDSNRFVVREYGLEDEKIQKKMRLLFVSDLHNKRYGKDNEFLLQEIDRISPDAILIGGDLFNGLPKTNLSVAISFLEKVKKYPLVYANGNHEHRIALYPEKYGTAAEEYEKQLKELDIHRLVNEKVYWEDSNITIYGSQIDRKYYERFHITPMDEQYLNETLGECDRNSFTILLAHNPDYFPQYAQWGADLSLAGHVHGGIVRIPGWKGVLSPNIRFFPKYDGGVFREKESQMIVSRGLGMHTIPFRLFNPAELVLIEISPKEKEVCH